MADLRGFDANQVEPSADFETLPAGKYEAVITESEMKPTKAGTGHYLQLTFQIIEGEFKNRFLWARLNLDNPNATAVQIARAELSATRSAPTVDTSSRRRSASVMMPRHPMPAFSPTRSRIRSSTSATSLTASTRSATHRLTHRRPCGSTTGWGSTTGNPSSSASSTTATRGKRRSSGGAGVRQIQCPIRRSALWRLPKGVAWHTPRRSSCAV